ncbi:MAG: VanZ family protein [Corynebacterium sp.]|nr:VanZ family protein [Corynebacterium sp.]
MVAYLSTHQSSTRLQASVPNNDNVAETPYAATDIADTATAAHPQNLYNRFGFLGHVHEGEEVGARQQWQTAGLVPHARVLQRLALGAYTAVIIALVLFKGLFSVADLWNPELQHQRGFSLTLFREILEGSSQWDVIFSYGGNIALLVPFGLITAGIVARRNPRWSAGSVVALTSMIGMALSLVLETLQYLFALGFSDIDDVLMNAIGAFAGAVLAMVFPRQMQRVWSVFVLIGCALFLYVAAQ